MKVPLRAWQPIICYYYARGPASERKQSVRASKKAGTRGQEANWAKTGRTTTQKRTVLPAGKEYSLLESSAQKIEQPRARNRQEQK